MRQSADPQERVIAQLQERVNTLELRFTQPRVPASPYSEDEGLTTYSLEEQIGNMIQKGLVQRNSPSQVVAEVNSWLDETGLQNLSRPC